MHLVKLAAVRLAAYSSLMVALATPSLVRGQSDDDLVRVAPVPVSLGEAGKQTPKPKFGICAKVPGNTRNLRLNLNPDTSAAEIVGWISSVTCKWFLFSRLDLSERKVTIVSPRLLTLEECDVLFEAVLESAGLVLQEAGKFQRVVVREKATSDSPVAKHFTRHPLKELLLVAIVSGKDAVRAMIRAGVGKAQIIRAGDRISSQDGRVAKILSDRIVVALPAGVDGERRTVEMAAVPDPDMAPPDDRPECDVKR